MKCIKTVAVIAALSFTVAGCVSKEMGAVIGGALGTAGTYVITDNIDNDLLRGLGIASGAALGAYIGYKFADSLSQRDQEKLLAAQQQAASTGRPVTFQGDNGVRGNVSVVNSQPAVKRDKVVPVKVLKEKVDKIPPIAMIGAPYSPKKSINVRSGPGTDYKVVSALAGGESVQVVGKVRNKKWYLISQTEDGTASGFVYSPLMSPTTKKPATYVQTSASEVSEVQVAVPASPACKTVRQEVQTAKGVIEEDIRVCKQNNGSWKVA